MHYICLVHVDGLLAGHHAFAGPLVVGRERRVRDANAEARARKVEIGMGLNEARLLADGLQIVDYDADHYRAAAERLWDGLADFSNYTQPMAEDRVFLDLSSHPDPAVLARRILLTHPSARVALAPCRWMAEAALSEAQPYRDITSDPEAFLHASPMDAFLGVETALRDRLKALGYQRIGELLDLKPELFTRQFGKEGAAIYRALRGMDDHHIEPIWPRASVAFHQETEGVTEEEAPIRSVLEALSKRVGEDLMRTDRSGKTIQLSWETEDGRWERRERTFARSAQSPGSVFALAQLLLRPWPTAPMTRMRLRMPHLTTAVRRQTGLGIAANGERAGELESVVSRVAGAFGSQSVQLAATIEEPRRKRLLRVWKDATGWY
jgi:DNA polymerase-4